MKKVILALALVMSTGLFLVSCKPKQSCDAYKSSAPVHHNGGKTNM